MIGAICLIACGALNFYRATKAEKDGNAKMAKILKIISAISVAAGVILGIAMLIVMY